jgi:hypothetical protein
MIDFKEHLFRRAYNEECKLPWINKIDERRYIYLNKYIKNKSASFSYIYFLLGPYYKPIKCKIKNVATDKYLNIVNPNEKENNSKINCDSIGSNFIIKAAQNKYLYRVNIELEGNYKNQNGKTGYHIYTIPDDNKVFGSGDDKKWSQFYLIPYDGYVHIQCYHKGKNINNGYGRFLYYDSEENKIRSDGNEKIEYSIWKIIII